MSASQNDGTDQPGSTDSPRDGQGANPSAENHGDPGAESAGGREGRSGRGRFPRRRGRGKRDDGAASAPANAGPSRRRRGPKGGAGQPEAADPFPKFPIRAAVGGDPEYAPKQAQGILPAAEDLPKLHKLLADSGLGSRREMEELIIAGRVSVNGQPAHVGQRISSQDQIRVNGRPLRRSAAALETRILIYHKPPGEICSRDDPGQRTTVFERLPRLKGARWVGVGRLDFNTEGLLIFTTSGELANKLMHPRYGWEREYAVRVLGRIDDEARAALLEGVELEDGMANVKSIEELGGEGANAWYRIVIGEGRNREVRRLVEAVGATVSRLVRVRFGPVALPHGLARGRWMELEPADVRALNGAIREAAGGVDDGEQEHDPEHDEDAIDDDHDSQIHMLANHPVEVDPADRIKAEHLDDDWQPSSHDAHLEGITRKVRSGDGGPGSGRRSSSGRKRGSARGAGGWSGGPMDGLGGSRQSPQGAPGGGRGRSGEGRGGQAAAGGKRRGGAGRRGGPNAAPAGQGGAGTGAGPAGDGGGRGGARRGAGRRGGRRGSKGGGGNQGGGNTAS